MTYIKKLVMKGFKSFARRTEIPFENSMNVIVGPNGSGKSNITDALCFVLGRLSIKSIRAAKAAHLLFSGNKIYKGSQEAFVELIFDNSDKTFSVDSDEVVIKRIVRKNGQSIYKINNETKTRQELLELLAQAGIDPNGFNIVLQGEIQSLVKATAEERRKIIEEVAGISVYESRKLKSLKELEKTQERLKEVSAILRERKSYLKNLEKERQEAINFQKLEKTIKRCKATIISKKIKEKEKEIWGTDKLIENLFREIEKIKSKIQERNSEIEILQNKIKTINKKIQDATTNEQEVLHKEISDLKVELAGLNVRIENFENRVFQGKEKIKELKRKISELNKEISEIDVGKPKIKEQQKQQKILQEKFDLLEQQRRRFYILKSELNTLENKKQEKERLILELKKEAQLTQSNISSLIEELKYARSIEEAEFLKKETKKQVNNFAESLKNLEQKILEKERLNAVLKQEISRENKLKEDVSQLKICPLCKQEVTEDHKHKINETASKEISNASKKINENQKTIEDFKLKIIKTKKQLNSLTSKLNEIGIDEIKLKNIADRRFQIKKTKDSLKNAEDELISLNKKIHSYRKEFEKLKGVEEEYDEVRLKLQELNFLDLDIDAESALKQKEINRLNIELKATIRDVEESEVELRKFSQLVEEKTKLVEKKEEEEQKLYEQFQKFFNEKNELQDKLKTLETDIIGFQHNISSLEEKINHNKIQRAQYSAQMDALKTELSEFSGVEIFHHPIEQVKERLQKAQFRISQFGNVNMRALEVFDKIQEQCDLIQKKVETIEEEEAKIKKIIEEIDKKKKKTFIKTLNAINEYFKRNFLQLFRKGEAFLELENKKNPFEGGLNILLRVAKGKYFDITSLSGGEKTMVALALIFAIQEYKPYCFYIFDEIDAALDKKNSELLASLIKKYMKSGQYIIVTHNDSLISEATTLYGVSMQDNISKIISLKI